MNRPITILEILAAMTPYELCQAAYRMWVEDDPWCWQYRLIHNAPDFTVEESIVVTEEKESDP